MAILSITTDVTGQIGIIPQEIYIKTNDTLTEVTTPGYLNQSRMQGFQFSSLQLAHVYGSNFNNGSYGCLDFQVVTPSNPQTGDYGLALISAPSTLPADTLFGNPTGSIAAPKPITLGPGVVFSGNNIEVNQGYLRQTSIQLTFSQINGMHATPLQVLPAVSGYVYDIESISFFNNAEALEDGFIGGGNVFLQAGTEFAIGSNNIITQTVSASDFQDWSGDGYALKLLGLYGPLSSNPTLAAPGKAVYLTNDTSSFTGGIGALQITIWYRLITLF